MVLCSRGPYSSPVFLGTIYCDLIERATYMNKVLFEVSLKIIHSAAFTDHDRHYIVLKVIAAVLDVSLR